MVLGEGLSDSHGLKFEYWLTSAHSCARTTTSSPRPLHSFATASPASSATDQCIRDAPRSFQITDPKPALAPPPTPWPGRVRLQFPPTQKLSRPGKVDDRKGSIIVFM